MLEKRNEFSEDDRAMMLACEKDIQMWLKKITEHEWLLEHATAQLRYVRAQLCSTQKQYDELLGKKTRIDRMSLVIAEAK